MENAEEILQCLDEFTKLRPKEIPPELEYYLSFVARTGDPVYQWPLIKCLFREKLINVITEFYEACPSVEIPPCPNVEIFNYEAMKGFILEKLDTFAAAPFTVQRICELLTSPRKEYNRIDKYMRALEKNILVVSTREPGNRKSTENGESIVNGLESEHGSQEMVNSLSSDINVEVDMDEKTVWHKSYAVNESSIILEAHTHSQAQVQVQESYVSESKTSVAPMPAAESVITARQINYIGYTNEMLVEPSTTISTSSSSNQDETQQQPEHEQQQEVEAEESSNIPSTVFSVARTAEKEEEQIYVTEENPFPKADCTDMETNEIMCETETEPITPPEPEPEQEPEASAEEAPLVKTEAESSVTSGLEAVVESSTTQTTTTATATTKVEAKAEKSGENETSISSSSSDERPQPQSSTEPSPPQPHPQVSVVAEVGSTDQHEVTASNIVIGPEDMQVEDISPEPQADAEAEAEAKQPKTTQVPEIQETRETPETREIQENVESTENTEVKNVESSSTNTEENSRASGDNVEETRQEDADEEQKKQVQVEAPQEIVKVVTETGTETETETNRETSKESN